MSFNFVYRTFLKEKKNIKYESPEKKKEILGVFKNNQNQGLLQNIQY